MKEIIINLVIERFSIDREILFKKTRKRESVLPRQIAMYLFRKYVKDDKGYQISFQSIADYFWLKKHETVMHACKTVEKYLMYKEYRINVSILEFKIKKELDRNIKKETIHRKLWENIGIRKGYLKLHLAVN